MTCLITGARPVNADFAFSGNWYDPATSGQGITVEINPLTPVAFFAWYTYVSGRRPAGAAGQRWYTGQSGYTAGARTLAMKLYETTGGLLDAPTTPPPHNARSGLRRSPSRAAPRRRWLQLHRRQQCGREGRIVLRRVGPVPPGCAM